MAPAAKESMYGNSGIEAVDKSITAIAPIGCMAPLRQPNVNDFHLLFPAALIGIETMAPSGTFCMAMPAATISALIDVIPVSACSAPASTTPTAMPSGRWCIDTASSSMVVRESLERGPSGFVVPK